MGREWIKLKEYGQLNLEKVLVSFDFPILFVCSDYENMKYLCLNIDDDSGKTVIAATNNEQLLSMLNNEIPMEMVFRNSINKIIVIAEYNADTEQIESYFQDADTVPENMLPQKNAYFELQNESIEDYIDELNRQIIKYEYITFIENELFNEKSKLGFTGFKFENTDVRVCDNVLISDTQVTCSYVIVAENKMIA